MVENVQNLYEVVIGHTTCQSSPLYFVRHNYVTPYIKLTCTAADCVVFQIVSIQFPIIESFHVL